MKANRKRRSWFEILYGFCRSYNLKLDIEEYRDSHCCRVSVLGVHGQTVYFTFNPVSRSNTDFTVKREMQFYSTGENGLFSKESACKTALLFIVPMPRKATIFSGCHELA